MRPPLSQSLNANTHLINSKNITVNKFNHWSVDRLGRLLSGIAISLFLVLSLVHPLWLWVSLSIASSLIITSVTNKCIIHDYLISLGAKEREDIFYPGGELIESLNKNKRTLIKKKQGDVPNV